MKNKKRFQIAKQILEAEQKIALGEDVERNKRKIQIISASLSLEDMLAIDEYIMKNKNI